MEFRLTKKFIPKIYKARTKKQLVSDITQYYVWSSGFIGSLSYSGYTNSSHTWIRVFSLEKHRRHKPDTPGHWVAYVYDISFKDLETFGYTEIHQNLQTFTLTK